MRVVAFTISAPFLEEDVYEISAVTSSVIASALVGGCTSASVRLEGVTPEDIVSQIIVVPKPVDSTSIAKRRGGFRLDQKRAAILVTNSFWSPAV